MRSLSLALLAVLTLLACGWDSDKPAQGTPRRRGPVPLKAAHPAAQTEEGDDFDDDWGDDDLGSAPAAAQAQEEPEEEEEDEDERDYSAELRNAFGSPLACLKQRGGEAAPPRITIDLTATVMTGGNISRASATSGELDDDELRCVRKQLEARRLAPEVQDAPRTVDATVTLELQKPKQ